MFNAWLDKHRIKHKVLIYCEIRNGEYSNYALRLYTNYISNIVKKTKHISIKVDAQSFQNGYRLKHEICFLTGLFICFSVKGMCKYLNRVFDALNDCNSYVNKFYFDVL